MIWRAVSCVAVALAFLCTGCGGQKGRPVSLVGSTSVQPFAELLEEEFEREHPDIATNVQGGGSAQGIAALRKGMADIGMCSRALSAEEEKEFRGICIAHDGLVLVVHPSNTVDNLRLEQIRKLFSGQVTNWRDVGGPDRRVQPVMREEGSGTREAFMKLVMGKVDESGKAIVQSSNGAVKEIVRGDPGAVGYMSLGLVGPELKKVRVDGIEATAAEVRAGRYKMSRPFLFVVGGQPEPKVMTFIDFALSDRGQKILAEWGLVSVK